MMGINGREGSLTVGQHPHAQKMLSNCCRGMLVCQGAECATVAAACCCNGRWIFLAESSSLAQPCRVCLVNKKLFRMAAGWLLLDTLLPRGHTALWCLPLVCVQYVSVAAPQCAGVCGCGAATCMHGV